MESKLDRFSSTKSFYNYPCSHRQWRHEGHCAYVHGYSRSFHFWFKCSELTDTGFVVDFGEFKDFKKLLDDWFDHALLINTDDPLLPDFLDLQRKGACKLTILANVGMEGTAQFLCSEMNIYLLRKTKGRAWCYRVEVRENEKNSGIYEEHR